MRYIFGIFFNIKLYIKIILFINVLHGKNQSTEVLSYLMKTLDLLTGLALFTKLLHLKINGYDPTNNH